MCDKYEILLTLLIISHIRASGKASAGSLPIPTVSAGLDSPSYWSLLPFYLHPSGRGFCCFWGFALLYSGKGASARNSHLFEGHRKQQSFFFFSALTVLSRHSEEVKDTITAWNSLHAPATLLLPHVRDSSPKRPVKPHGQIRWKWNPRGPVSSCL